MVDELFGFMNCTAPSLSEKEKQVEAVSINRIFHSKMAMMPAV